MCANLLFDSRTSAAKALHGGSLGPNQQREGDITRENWQAGSSGHVGGGLRLALFGGAFKLSSAQMIRRFVRIPLLLISARLLGPEPFGLYIFLIAVIEALSVLSGQGFAEYLAREGAKRHDSALQLAFHIIRLRCLYSLLLLSISLPGLAFLGYSRLVIGNAALLSAILFPRAIIDATQGLFRAARRFGILPGLELVQGGVLLAVGLPLLSLGHGLRALIFAELLSALAGALVGAPIVLKLFPNGSSSVSLVGLVRRTFAFNIYPLINSLYDRIDVVLLSKLAGNAAVGLYAMPYRALYVLQLLPYGLMTAALPSLATFNWDQDGKHVSGELLRILYGSALFFVLSTMLLATPVVQLTLGMGYQNSSLILKVLIWALIPMFLNHGLNTMLLAISRERAFLWTGSICTVVNLTLNFILIPRFSYIAAAAVTIITEMVLLVQNVILIRRAVGFVPIPHNLLRSSLGFGVFLSVSLVATRFSANYLLGLGLILAFGWYLQLHLGTRFLSLGGSPMPAAHKI